MNPDVEKLTIAEIEPLVPRVVSEYFAAENHGVIRNPKVTIRIEHKDARGVVRHTEERTLRVGHRGTYQVAD